MQSLQRRRAAIMLGAVAALGGTALRAEPVPAPAAQSAPAATPPAKAARFDPAKLTAADFARLPFVEKPVLSPRGDRVAGLFGVNGQQVVMVLALTTADTLKFSVGVPDQTEVDWIRWVNDDYVLIGVRAQQNVEANRWYINRVLSLDLRKQRIVKTLWNVGGQSVDLIWLPHDGSTNVLMAAQNSVYTNYREFWPTVYRVDVTDGDTAVVQQGQEGVMNWIADATGRVRAGLSRQQGGLTARLIYRAEGNDQFQRLDRADMRKRESLLQPIAFVPGTNHALVQVEQDNGRDAVLEYDMGTGKDVAKLAESPEGRDIEGVLLAADGHTMLGYYSSDPVKPATWVDPQLAETQAAIGKAVGTRSAQILSFNQDRTRMLVKVSRPDSPGSLYFYDVADGKLRFLAYFNETFGTRPLSSVQLVHYTARDGTPIEAVLTLPAGRQGRNLPIVMLPHGGPWAQDTASYDFLPQFIASRGYAVLQPNFRGSTGYGEAFERKGEGQMGLAMQDNITDGLRWAAAQGIADPARACIVGWSYGGYAAMWGIAKDPELYRCAVSIAGVSSLPRDAAGMGDNLYASASRLGWQRMTVDPNAVSPLNAVARITTPLLLIHGKKDVRVDVDQSHAMFSRMTSARKTVEYLPVAQADHYFTREADRTALLAAVEGFLAKYNPPAP